MTAGTRVRRRPPLAAFCLLAAVATLAWVGRAEAASPEPDTWPIQASRSHAQCPWRLEGPDARVFSSARHWLEMTSVPEDRAVGANVDWQRDDLIVFALDTQPTMGVKVQPTRKRLELHERDARLHVRVTRPGPDDMTASALSRPCVVIKVPKRRWRALEVRDDKTGAMLWRGKVRAKH